MKSKLLLLVTFIASFLTITSSNVNAVNVYPCTKDFIILALPENDLENKSYNLNNFTDCKTFSYSDLGGPSFGYITYSVIYNLPNNTGSLGISNTRLISSFTTTLPFVYPQITAATTTTIPRQKCLPWKDKLVLYPELANVTNNGYYFTQYQANCDYGKLLYSQVKSKYSTKRISPSNHGDFDKYFNRKKSNCWRIRHVTTNGASPWSNRVCYNHKKYKTYWSYPSSPYWPPIGSICKDGWLSPSVGSGTCSWHGGIAK